MASDIKLFLMERYIKTGAIFLGTDLYSPTDRSDFKIFDRDNDDSGLMINVHKKTGEPLLFVIEDFKEETEYAIEMLRKYPLPWTFNLESFNLKNKPLGNILYEVFKKYRDTKLEWE